MLQQHLEKDATDNNEDSHSSAKPLINDLKSVTTSSSPHLYLVVAAIISTEFCERLCYYGIQGSLNLFLQTELNQSKADASFNVSIFGGVCYLTPLLGGYIADTYLGRYRSILLFVTFYLLGIAGVAVIAWILSHDDTDTPMQSEEISFWIALYLIALGTGGIKPNVSTLGAEQFETDQPQFSIKHTAINTNSVSELMPVPFHENDDDDDSLVKETENDNLPYSLPIAHSNDHSDALLLPSNNITETETNNTANHETLKIDECESNKLLSKQRKQKESFFNWFYFSINFGSFFAYTIIAYLCQNVNFGIGYFVPTVVLVIGLIIFMAASKYYRVVAAQGSILSRVMKILFYGLMHGGLDNAKIKYGNDEVESVKSIIGVLPFLAYGVIYWCVYAQQSTLFYAQGCQMDITIYGDIEIPIATLGLFDVIPILILLPFFDRILIPCLRKKGFRVTMLQRMGCGFLCAVMAMICAAILEIWRKKANLTSIESACNDGNSEPIYVSDMSIFWQIPQFIFVGTSEVLASVTGLEFFFSQAPPEMRSILASLNLVTTGLGSWLVGLFILLVNINKNDKWITDDLNNGHLDYYFLMIAFLCFLAFCAFARSALKYEYNTFEKDLLVQDDTKPNEDEIFDDVMKTSPRTPGDERLTDFQYQNVQTPPAQIKLTDFRIITANHNE